MPPVRWQPESALPPAWHRLRRGNDGAAQEAGTGPSMSSSNGAASVPSRGVVIQPSIEKAAASGLELLTAERRVHAYQQMQHERELQRDANAAAAAAARLVVIAGGALPSSALRPAGSGGGWSEADAEEERARARRQHRKRVARIVVDHWKWFAGERLAVSSPLPLVCLLFLISNEKWIPHLFLPFAQSLSGAASFAALPPPAQPLGAHRAAPGGRICLRRLEEGAGDGLTALLPPSREMHQGAEGKGVIMLFVPRPLTLQRQCLISDRPPHHAIQEWHAAAARLSLLARRRLLLTRGRESRLRRDVVRLWRTQCLVGAEKRRRKIKAWYFYSFITLSKAVRAWRSAAAARALSRAAKAQAHSHWRGKALKACLGDWQARVHEMQEEARKSHVASSHAR